MRKASRVSKKLPAGLVIAPKDWNEMPLALRRDIVRLSDELNTGIAIAKDRRLGRPKRDPDGFYGLHGAERDGAPDLEERRERAVEDEAALAMMDAILAEFGPIAEAEGKTLPEWIQSRVDLEHMLKTDVTCGLFQICDMVGVEPVAMLLAAREMQH